MNAPTMTSTEKSSQARQNLTQASEGPLTEDGLPQRLQDHRRQQPATDCPFCPITGAGFCIWSKQLLGRVRHLSANRSHDLGQVIEVSTHPLSFLFLQRPSDPQRIQRRLHSLRMFAAHLIEAQNLLHA